jgi:hypothetical protein
VRGNSARVARVPTKLGRTKRPPSWSPLECFERPWAWESASATRRPSRSARRSRRERCALVRGRCPYCSEAQARNSPSKNRRLCDGDCNAGTRIPSFGRCQSFAAARNSEDLRAASRDVSSHEIAEGVPPREEPSQRSRGRRMVLRRQHICPDPRTAGILTGSYRSCWAELLASWVRIRSARYRRQRSHTDRTVRSWR